MKVISTNMLPFMLQKPYHLNNTLTLKFKSPLNNLFKFDVLCCTYMKKSTGINFSIMDEHNNVLYSYFNLNIEDNKYTSFFFPPILNSKNKTYFIKLHSNDDFTSVWYNDEINYNEIEILNIKGSINCNIYCAQDIDQYSLYIEKNENIEDIKKQKNHKFKYNPLISIITPTYNTPTDVLKNTIESILNQTYENWELCIADASTDKNTINLLKDFSNKNKKIKIKYLKKNKGIVGNSNEAYSIANGEFIVIFDHDDILAPDALFECIKELNNDKNLDLIYSDSDILMNGKRVLPFFKPDFSPDYLLSCNYLCHINMIRKSLIDSVGGFMHKFEGSQDYDLLLRITENTNKIKHIPKILYHWNAIAGSAAHDSNAKTYAYDNAQLALEEALKRRKLKGKIEKTKYPGFYITKLYPKKEHSVSIIILNKNNLKVLNSCITSIKNKVNGYQNYDIIIVDNNSTDKDLLAYYNQITKKNDNIKILHYNDSFNYSIMNNLAVKESKSDYVLLLNNDIEIITNDFIRLMLGYCERDNTGIVSNKLLYPNNKIQHAGIILGVNGYVGLMHKNEDSNKNSGYWGSLISIRNYNAIATASAMIKKSIYNEVNGMDEKYVVANGDIDFCLKVINKNYLITYLPYVEMYHLESYTRGSDENSERFKNECIMLWNDWKEFILNDKFYNKNLNKDFLNFQLIV